MIQNYKHNKSLNQNSFEVFIILVFYHLWNLHDIYSQILVFY